MPLIDDHGIHRKEGWFEVELRTLRYFLALASEGTVSRAAASLHVTQPTLSRQLADLEREFGKQLFVRGPKRIQLTEDGVVLRDYAQTIVELADKAADELLLPTHAVAGSVRIGCGEARASQAIWSAMAAMRADYPQVKFHVHSGNSTDLLPHFESGLLDFLEECELAGHGDCHVVPLPDTDRWGVVVRADDPLAALDRVRPEDLAGRAVIGSRQGMRVAGIPEWQGRRSGRCRWLPPTTCRSTGPRWPGRASGCASCTRGSPTCRIAAGLRGGRWSPR